jgi:hypothetical protein
MRGMEKAAKSAPWVAIALALIGPLFSYLEVREARRSARGDASDAQGATGAAYRLLVREIERQTEDIDACHERVGRLAEALEELAMASPLEVTEQAAIERPAAREELPTEASELPKGAPLKKALEKADLEDW